ncbi:hypothetical protein MMC25_002303 [Agyrium rufum]|nr:hypothetical protein [Agyrium rufum]
MSKKPALLLCSHTHLPIPYASYQFHARGQHHDERAASCNPTRRNERRQQSQQQRRHYADISSNHNYRHAFPSRDKNNKSSSNLDLEIWPRLPSATSIPTPYQIFHLHKDAPYSKRRFYELVKIYHPDRHHASSSPSSPSSSSSTSSTSSPSNSSKTHQAHSIPQTIKLERYRLVVAANDILSNPTKRHAYDTYGAGWSKTHAHNRCGTSSPSPHHPYPNNTHQNAPNHTSWSGFSSNDNDNDNNNSTFHSAAQNATWEDWERWHDRRSSTRTHPVPEPIFLSNGAFFGLVAFLAALGSLTQYRQVGNVSQTFIEQVEARHDQSSRDLRRSREGAFSGGEGEDGDGDGRDGDGEVTREEVVEKDRRIRNFLRNRERVDLAGAEGMGMGLGLGFGGTLGRHFEGGGDNEGGTESCRGLPVPALAQGEGGGQRGTEARNEHGHVSS